MFEYLGDPSSFVLAQVACGRCRVDTSDSEPAPAMPPATTFTAKARQGCFLRVHFGIQALDFVLEGEVEGLRREVAQHVREVAAVESAPALPFKMRRAQRSAPSSSSSAYWSLSLIASRGAVTVFATAPEMPPATNRLIAAESFKPSTAPASLAPSAPAATDSATPPLASAISLVQVRGKLLCCAQGAPAYGVLPVQWMRWSLPVRRGVAQVRETELGHASDFYYDTCRRQLQRDAPLRRVPRGRAGAAAGRITRRD